MLYALLEYYRVSVVYSPIENCLIICTKPQSLIGYTCLQCVQLSNHNHNLNIIANASSKLPLQIKHIHRQLHTVQKPVEWLQYSGNSNNLHV